MERLRTFISQGQKGKLLMLLVILAALPITVSVAQRVVMYFSQAAGEAVTFSFTPSSLSLDQNETANVSLFLDAKTNPVGFVRAAVIFDPTKVQLTEVASTSEGLTMNNSEAESLPDYDPPTDACVGADPCIVKSSITNANTDGKLVLVLGKDPSLVSLYPTDQFKIADLQLKAVTDASDASAIVQIDLADSQVVNSIPTDLDITKQDLNITLNPTAVPGDADGDQCVNAIDLQLLSNNFGKNYPPADWGGTLGVVDAVDLQILSNNYGTCKN